MGTPLKGGPKAHTSLSGPARALQRNSPGRSFCVGTVSLKVHPPGLQCTVTMSTFLAGTTIIPTLKMTVSPLGSEFQHPLEAGSCLSTLWLNFFLPSAARMTRPKPSPSLITYQEPQSTLMIQSYLIMTQVTNVSRNTTKCQQMEFKGLTDIY